MLKDLTNNPKFIDQSKLIDTALIDFSSGKAKSYTFLEIDQHINLIVSGLMKKNHAPETRLAILANNSFKYIITYLAIRRAGLVPVLINFKLTNEQILKIISHSDSEFIFYDEEFLDKIPKNLPSLSFDKLDTLMSTDSFVEPVDNQERPAFFLYTSGTTGEPKGVVVSTKSRRWLIESQYKSNSDLRVLISTPMYHMNGLSNIERRFNNKTTVILLPSFDAEKYIEIIDQYKINILTVVPPMMAMILNHRSLTDSHSFASVIEIIMASAPTSPQLFNQVKKRFPNAKVRLRYGLTEVGPSLFGPPPKGLKEPQMSVGYPRSDIEYKLIDGVLHIKSPSMLSNYHKNPELYANALTEDGFFNTKDKFFIDKNGFYFFVGRADDMFVSGGENIFPSQVEEVIEKHPGIAEAAVIGLPDDIKGTKPYAFVVRVKDSNVSEEEIKEFVLSNAPAYQHPRRVWFLDQMPLTGTNKINKSELEVLAKSYL